MQFGRKAGESGTAVAKPTTSVQHDDVSPPAHGVNRAASAIPDVPPDVMALMPWMDDVAPAHAPAPPAPKPAAPAPVNAAHEALVEVQATTASMMLVMNISDSVLADASFFNWEMHGASFFNCQLQRARWRSVLAHELNVFSASAAYSSFVESDFKGGKFAGCDLQGAAFDRSCLRNVTFSDCDLRLASLASVVLAKTRLNRCRARGVMGVPTQPWDSVVLQLDVGSEAEPSYAGDASTLIESWQRTVARGPT